MRILVISNYYPPLEIGGWEQLTRDVTEELARRGHDVHVLSSFYRVQDVPEEPTVSRLLHLESLDHAHYHLAYMLTRRSAETENVAILTNIVHKFKPDVIFINGMWNLPVVVAQAAESLLPHRVVYYVASYWPIEEDAHSLFWRTGSLLKRWIGHLVMRALARPTPRSQLEFEHVLCVSEFMRQKLIRGGAVLPQNSRVVFNGINPDLFVPAANENPSEVRLLYAGRLSPDKGVHTAVEALAQLPPNILDRTTLTIVGSGTPEYTTRLRSLIESLSLSERVSLVGQVPREQMPDILANHDILLLLSIWDEPLARMTQEAMAAGLVVIGTPTGGTPEILEDGKNGLWVEPDNPQQLAEKIAFLANHPEMWQKFAVAARQTVLDKFTFRRMVDEIESYFTMLLDEIEPEHTTGASL